MQLHVWIPGHVHGPPLLSGVLYFLYHEHEPVTLLCPKGLYSQE